MGKNNRSSTTRKCIDLFLIIVVTDEAEKKNNKEFTILQSTRANKLPYTDVVSFYFPIIKVNSKNYWRYAMEKYIFKINTKKITIAS